MKKSSSSLKFMTAAGFIALIAMFAVGAFFIFEELNRLTATDDSQTALQLRQRATNDVVTSLYRAEIIGQSLSAGETDIYPQYVKAMRQTEARVDTLRKIVSEPKQVARLDSISSLLKKKMDNMKALTDAITVDNSDDIFQQYLEEMIKREKALASIPKVRRSDVVRTEERVIKRNRKNFFGRVRDVFTGGDKEEREVTTITEQQRDSLQDAAAPDDSLERFLANLGKQINSDRLAQLAALHNRIEALRDNSLLLSNKVNKLLNTVVDESERIAAEKQATTNSVRRQAARVITSIGLICVVLALLFLARIWRDIHRSVRYRQEIETARNRAESLLQQRESLMLTITHDIKAPVGAVIGYTDMIEHTQMTDEQSQFVRSIQSAANHLLKLVTNLLDFHRLDAGKMEVTNESFAPAALFTEIAESHRPAAAAKGLQLTANLSGCPDGTFVSDVFRIRQIADNLITNALKFTSHGQISLCASVDDSLLRFSVTDTGCGMNDNDLNNIFKEFTRLKNAQGEEGVGLGLSIVAKLVTLLHGEISVESHEGRGSTFSVAIPLNGTAMIPASETTKVAEEKKKFSHPLRIAVIDDDRIQLKLLKAMLKRTGASVTAFQRPSQLFEEVVEKDFDVLLTDVQMPAMNGYELLHALRSLPSDRSAVLPVIAVSARSDINTAQVRATGFADCLHKPFSISDAVAVIEGVTDVVRTYNFSALTEFSGDDKDAAREILTTFAADMQKNIERMQQGMAESNIGEMAAAAHKMLPLMTMICADRAVAPLRRLNDRREATEIEHSDFDDACVIIEETTAALHLCATE